MKLDKQNIEDIISLTPTQAGMLYYYMKDESCDEYNVRLEFKLKGSIKVSLFEKAWNYLTQINEVLRTTYRWELLKEPVQIVLKKHKVKFKYHELDKLGSNDLAKYQNDLSKKQDLRNVPFEVVLCKMKQAEYSLNILTHHLVFDGWGSSILMKEFFEIYNNLISNKETKLISKPKFKTYCTWLKSLDKQENLMYWRKYIKGFSRSYLADLLGIDTSSSSDKYNAGNVSFKMSSTETDKINKYAASIHITTQTFIKLVWAVMLSKISNKSDVTFGIVVSGRPPQIKDVDSIVGLFINTVPVRLRIGNNVQFSALARKFHEEILKQEPYQYFPLIEIQTLANNHALFDHFLTFLDYPLEESLMSQSDDLYVSELKYVEKSNFDIDILINIKKEIEIKFRYNSFIFPKLSIERITNYLKGIFKQVVDNPEIFVDDISISTHLNKAENLQDILFQDSFNL